MADPCIGDTCSVDLTVDPGTGELNADVILDPAGAITCTPGQGLGVNVGTSGCGVDLSVVGNEIVANLDLSATGGLECAGGELGINLDSNVCNGLALSASGLYYNDHTSRLFSGPAGGTTGNGSTGVTIGGVGVVIDPWAFQGAYGTNLREITARTSLSYTNTTCRTVNFLATWTMGPPQLAFVNGWLFAIGSRNSVSSPSLTGTSYPSVQYDSVSGPFATAADTLGLTFPPAVYTVQSFLLPGETVTTTVSLFAQAVTIGANDVLNTAKIFFGQGQGVNLWTR